MSLQRSWWDLLSRECKCCHKVICGSLACCSQLCLLRLRRPVDGAAGQHRAGVHRGHRRWPHPGALLPVPPVCRQRRGKRPVQQRDRQVSPPLHLLNVSDVAAGLCASHRNGVALVCFHRSGTARTFPLVFSCSIENPLIISCKSSSFFWLRSCGREWEMRKLWDGPFSR